MTSLHNSKFSDASRIRALKHLNLISDHLIQKSSRKDYKCMQILTTRMSEKGIVQDPYRKKSHWYYTYGVLGSLGENMNDGLCELIVIPVKIRWLDYFPVVSQSFFFKTKVMMMVELGKQLHISNVLLNDQKVIQFCNYTRKFRKLLILMLESMQPYQKNDLTLEKLDLVFKDHNEVQKGFTELNNMNINYGYKEDITERLFSQARYDRFSRNKHNIIGCKMTKYEQAIMSYMKLSNVGPIDNAYIMISLQAYDTKIRKRTKSILLTASELYTEIQTYCNNPEKVLAAHLDTITLAVIKQGFLSQIEASLKENNDFFSRAGAWITRTATEYETDRYLSTSMISSSAWAIDSVVLLCLYIPGFLRFVKFIRSQYLKMRVLMSQKTIDVKDSKGNMQKESRSLLANLWSLMEQNWKDLDEVIKTWAEEVLDFVSLQRKSGETVVGLSRRKAKTIFKCTKLIYRMNEVVLSICVWSGHVESQFDMLRACFEYALGSKGVDLSNTEFHADILDKLDNINLIQRLVLYAVARLLESFSCASNSIGLDKNNSFTSMFLNKNVAYVGSSTLVLAIPPVYEFLSDHFSNTPTLEGVLIVETVNSLGNQRIEDKAQIVQLFEENVDTQLRAAQMNLELLSLNDKVNELNGNLEICNLKLIENTEQMSKATLLIGNFIAYQNSMGDCVLNENVKLLKELKDSTDSAEPVIYPSLSELEIDENMNRGNMLSRFEEISDIVIRMTNVEHMHQQRLWDIIESLHFVNYVLSHCCIIQKKNNKAQNYFAILRIMNENRTKIDAIIMDNEDIFDMLRDDTISISDEVKKYMFVKIAAFTDCKLKNLHNTNIKNYGSEIELVQEIEDLLIDKDYEFKFEDFVPSVMTHDCNLVNLNILFKLVNTMFFEFDFSKDSLVCMIMKTESMIYGDDYSHKHEPSEDDFGEILRCNIETLLTLQSKNMKENYEHTLDMKIVLMKKNRRMATRLKDNSNSYDDSIDHIKKSLNILDIESSKINNKFLEMLRKRIKLGKTIEEQNYLFAKAAALLAKNYEQNDIKIKLYSSLFKNHKKNRESEDHLIRNLKKFKFNIDIGIYQKESK